MNTKTILGVVGGVVGLGLIVFLAISIAQGGGGSEALDNIQEINEVRADLQQSNGEFPTNEDVAQELEITVEEVADRDRAAGYAAVEVAGDVLPSLPQGGNDPAVGTAAPTVSGINAEGEPIEFGPGDTPKAMVFLAHGCRFCQEEVPLVQNLADQGGLPGGVQLVSVVTGTNPIQQGWPPQDWLEEEGWTAPALLDSASMDVARAYGMTGTPFWAFLDSQNRVIARVSGLLSAEQLQQFFSLTAMDTIPSDQETPDVDPGGATDQDIDEDSTDTTGATETTQASG